MNFFRQRGGFSFSKGEISVKIFEKKQKALEISEKEGYIRELIRGVAQSGLERCVRDAKVGGSNPLTPTIFLASSTVCDITSYLL